MKVRPLAVDAWVILLGLLIQCGVVAAADKPTGSPGSSAATLNFNGTVYHHRWSKSGGMVEGPRPLDREGVDVLGQDAIAGGLAIVASDQMTRATSHAMNSPQAPVSALRRTWL